MCTSGDLDTVQRIEKTSFSDPYPPIVFWNLYLDPESIFRVAFVEDIQGGMVIGYSVSKIEFEGRKGPFGHVISLAVDPSYRRTGVGARLLEDTISKIRLRGIRSSRVELEVRSDNNEAISLYERFGFVRETVLMNYYGLNSHAYRMKLDL